MGDTFEHFSQVKIIECNDFIGVLTTLLATGNILLVTSKGFTKRGVVTKLVNTLGTSRVRLFDEITPNPEKVHLQTAVASFNNESIEHVVALGGGSVIDAAKVFCGLLSNSDLCLDDLLLADSVEKRINLIAIPTTSGTGAEVTPFATVWQSDLAKKHSLYGVKADTVILDPCLTLSLGSADTLYPALDALSHSLESLWNKHRTPESEAFAKDAISRICRSLPSVIAQPQNIEARRDLQHGATLAGLAISITRTAIAHALSYPLTARYGIPHGLACSFTLLAIIQVIGHQKLGLTEALAKQVVRLLGPLDLGGEIEKYVQWPEVQSLALLPMDVSRAGNFIAPMDPVLLGSILANSRPVTKQVNVL
jgi:alcohol dehydrogenase